MRLTSLTFLILNVNAALDTGKYDHFTIQDVEERIENREVIPWLVSELGKDIDLSVFDTATVNELHDGLLDILGGNKGRESRKWGIEKRGLCLLVAWVVELIQWKR